MLVRVDGSSSGFRASDVPLVSFVWQDELSSAVQVFWLMPSSWVSEHLLVQVVVLVHSRFHSQSRSCGFQSFQCVCIELQIFFLERDSERSTDNLC
jgi:hypothetical protein